MSFSRLFTLWSAAAPVLTGVSGCVGMPLPAAVPAIAAPHADVPAPAAWAQWPPVPTLIAHRGASALRPEHTLAAYARAIQDGADLIEPDLVISRDGVLIVRHENALAVIDAAGRVTEATTDVANRAEFAARRTTKTIAGRTVTGWFTEDFTLAELKTLRARERLSALRPGNQHYDDQYEIATLQEVIDLASGMSAESGRTVGIYPETKHPAYFRGIGLALEEPLVELLRQNGWNDSDAPVFIQSFDADSLRRLRGQTRVRLVQLLDRAGATAARIDTVQGLRAVAAYAHGIGLTKALVLEPETEMEMQIETQKETPPGSVPNHAEQPVRPTTLVARAHAAGLFVHVYTLRPENAFMPARWKRPPAGDDAAPGDLRAEARAYLDAGVDGFFTDDPAAGRSAIDATAFAASKTLSKP